jgi:hypothetical protein
MELKISLQRRMERDWDLEDIRALSLETRGEGG